MDDLGHDPHSCVVRAELSGAGASIPLATGVRPGSVTAGLLAEFQNVGQVPRASVALAALRGRRTRAWRLDRQARAVTREAALMRPSLAW